MTITGNVLLVVIILICCFIAVAVVSVEKKLITVLRQQADINFKLDTLNNAKKTS